ncbi:MAG: hypothetical protein KDD94_13555, partial [Calditrichaeota bacterium]|nr:hypothetical protein [Calditrichota bacterium]
MKLFISVLLISLSAHSQVSISNTIYRFLDHQYGIRSASLSGANLAVDNSISDVLVNPASLRVENESIGFSLASYLLDTKYGQISYNHPLELGQSLALSVFALVSNSFELRQEDGVLIGDYSVSDFAVSISLIDQNLLDDFAFAITGKLVQSRIESFNSSAILFDFSTYIKAA